MENEDHEMTPVVPQSGPSMSTLPSLPLRDGEERNNSHTPFLTSSRRDAYTKVSLLSETVLGQDEDGGGGEYRVSPNRYQIRKSRDRGLV